MTRRYDCADCKELFSAYIDKMLSERETSAFEEHIKCCDACADELKDLNELVSSLGLLPEMELPEGFHEAAMKKIMFSKKNIHVTRWHTYAAAAASMLIMFIAISAMMSSFAEKDENSPDNYLAAPESRMMLSGENNGYLLSDDTTDTEETMQGILGVLSDAGDTVSEEGLKDPELDTGSLQKESDDLARGSSIMNTVSDVNTFDTFSASVDPKTMKSTEIWLNVDDLDTALSEINAMQMSFLSRDISDYYGGRRASLYVSVDAASFDIVLELIKSVGELKSQSEKVTIVSSDLSDVSAHLNSKQTEYDNIFSLLEKTKDVSEMLLIENRLSSLIVTIENYNTQLNTWENQEQNPKINIIIQQNEKIPESEKTPLNERLADTFVNSLNATTDFMQNSLVFLATAFIPLMFIGAVAAVIFVVTKKRGLKIG